MTIRYTDGSHGETIFVASGSIKIEATCGGAGPYSFIGDCDKYGCYRYGSLLDMPHTSHYEVNQ